MCLIHRMWQKLRMKNKGVHLSLFLWWSKVLINQSTTNTGWNSVTSACLHHSNWIYTCTPKMPVFMNVILYDSGNTDDVIYTRTFINMHRFTSWWVCCCSNHVFTWTNLERSSIALHWQFSALELLFSANWRKNKIYDIMDLLLIV